MLPDNKKKPARPVWLAGFALSARMSCAISVAPDSTQEKAHSMSSGPRGSSSGCHYTYDYSG